MSRMFCVVVLFAALVSLGRTTFHYHVEGVLTIKVNIFSLNSLTAALLIAACRSMINGRPSGQLWAKLRKENTDPSQIKMNIAHWVLSCPWWQRSALWLTFNWCVRASALWKKKKKRLSFNSSNTPRKRRHSERSTRDECHSSGCRGSSALVTGNSRESRTRRLVKKVCLRHPRRPVEIYELANDWRQRV